MFIKRHGRRCLILHSYRDGRGQVCHRRLGHFLDAAGLDRALSELRRRCPELATQTAKIREQGLGHLEGRPPGPTAAQRAEKIRKAARALLNCLAEETDEAVLENVAADLELLGARLASSDEPDRLLTDRSRLAPRRRRFDPSDESAQDYGRALDQQADDLLQEGRLSEGADVLAERVARCSTPESRLRFGVLLHRLGRFGEARAQYEHLPKSNPLRHLHSAAACWREGLQEETVHHLCRGVLREPELAQQMRIQKRLLPPTGAYWEQFGDLWTEAGVRFAMALCSEYVVRRRVRESREAKLQPRQMIPNFVLRWLVPKALAIAALPPDADVRAFELDWRRQCEPIGPNSSTASPRDV